MSLRQAMKRSLEETADGEPAAAASGMLGGALEAAVAPAAKRPKPAPGGKGRGAALKAKAAAAAAAKQAAATRRARARARPLVADITCAASSRAATLSPPTAAAAAGLRRALTGAVACGPALAGAVVPGHGPSPPGLVRAAALGRGVACALAGLWHPVLRHCSLLTGAVARGPALWGPSRSAATFFLYHRVFLVIEALLGRRGSSRRCSTAGDSTL